MTTYIINGYGVPKDIALDINYITYLNLVFNYIYENSANVRSLIIPSGGETNCSPPFLGSEGDIMAQYLKKLIGRDLAVEVTKKWEIACEANSLSSLENLLFAKDQIIERELTGPIVIFCEYTRIKKIQLFADKIFPSFNKVVVGFDFDTSAQRYLDPKFIQQKEQESIIDGLWTLENENRLAKHHQFFLKKLELLRQWQREGMSHQEAIARWYQEAKTIATKLYADHPTLNLG